MRALPRMMTTALMMMILALSATPTKAENIYDIVWDGTLTAIWQAGDYQPVYQSRMILVSSTPNPGLGGMSPAPLNLDFSTDKQLRFTLSAPAGQAFRIVPPALPLGAVFEFEKALKVTVGSAGVVTGAMFPGTVDSIQFGGLQGSAPPVLNASFDYGSASFNPAIGPQFEQVVTFGLSAPLTFTSLMMTFTAPPEMTLSTTAAPYVVIEASTTGFFDWEAGHGLAPPDPGVWVSLVAVPEIDPASCGNALSLVLGALGLTERLARRRLLS